MERPQGWKAAGDTSRRRLVGLLGSGTSGPRAGPSRRLFLGGAAGAGVALPSMRSKPAGDALADDARLLVAPQRGAQRARLQLGPQQAPALTPLYAGLAGRLSARCNIVCVGDSITEGQHAEGPPSTGFENRWLARLRDTLRAAYPTQGLAGGGRGFIGAMETGEMSFTWPTSIAGTPSTAQTSGPKAKFVQLNGSGQSIAFALVGDSADIMWTQ